MIRLLLLCALFALFVPAFAQDAAAPARPTLPAVSLLTTPPAMVAPLRGVVTLVEPRGQFYINLGTKDQLATNAELLIVRDSFVLARATVIKSNWLESVAELAPESKGLLLHAGDVVLVQCNPQPKEKAKGLPPYEITDDHEIENAFTLILFIAGAIALFN